MSKELIEELNEQVLTYDEWAREKCIEKLAADRIEQLEAEVERLKTTPAHKREDLRCVISDLCEQVRAREEQLEAVTNQRDEWVKTACKLPEVSAALKFAVEQGVKFQQQLAECQAALALKDEALLSAHECLKFYSHPGAKLVAKALFQRYAQEEI